MLTQMRICNVKCLREKILQHSTVLKQSLSTSMANNEKNDVENQLKRWKEIGISTDRSVVPKHLSWRFIDFIQSAEIFLNPFAMSEFLKNKSEEAFKNLQKVNPVIEECVGFEIALAYFLVFQGGKVKFKGHDNWIQINDDKMSADLPKKYDPNYVVTEIDASNIKIFYDSLLNFRNGQRIKRAIFKNSPLFDDWYVDRISSYFPYLEYLDISECPKVSERALEALYRCSDLKTLIITNYAKTAAFELSYLMLEDCIPGLKVEILEPKEITQAVSNKI